MFSTVNDILVNKKVYLVDLQDKLFCQQFNYKVLFEI